MGLELKCLVVGARNWNKPVPIIRELKTLPPDTTVYTDMHCELGRWVIAVCQNLKLKLKVVLFEDPSLIENVEPDMVYCFHPYLQGSKISRQVLVKAQHLNIPIHIFPE